LRNSIHRRRARKQRVDGRSERVTRPGSTCEDHAGDTRSRGRGVTEAVDKIPAIDLSAALLQRPRPGWGRGAGVDIEQEVIKTVRSVLSLDARSHPLDARSPLLGSIAELDSMAVVSILTALEERFGIAIDDDEV